MVLDLETRPLHNVGFGSTPEIGPNSNVSRQERIGSVHELEREASSLPWEVYSTYGEEVAKSIFGTNRESIEVIASEEGVIISNRGALVIPPGTPRGALEVFLTQPSKTYLEKNIDSFIAIRLTAPSLNQEYQGILEQADDMPPEMDVLNLGSDTMRSHSSAVTNPKSLTGLHKSHLLRQGLPEDEVNKMSLKELEMRSPIGKANAGVTPSMTPVRKLHEIAANSASSPQEGLKMETAVSTLSMESIDRAVQHPSNYASLIESAIPSLEKMLRDEGDDERIPEKRDTQTKLTSLLYDRRGHDKFRPSVVSDSLIILEDRRSLKHAGEIIIMKKNENNEWTSLRLNADTETMQIDSWLAAQNARKTS